MARDDFIVRHASSAVIENNGRFSGKVLADSCPDIGTVDRRGDIGHATTQGYFCVAFEGADEIFCENEAYGL